MEIVYKVTTIIPIDTGQQENGLGKEKKIKHFLEDQGMFGRKQYLYVFHFQPLTKSSM